MSPEEGEEWKRIALWLADCHAGTAEYDGNLSSVSKTRKERFVDICGTAAHMLDRELFPGHRPSNKHDVIYRLRGVVNRQLQKATEVTTDDAKLGPGARRVERRVVEQTAKIVGEQSSAAKALAVAKAHEGAVEFWQKGTTLIVRKF